MQYDMNRLNRAISWYNAIREGSHETEVALIEKEISAIDNLLGRGVEELTWNDDCMYNFARDTVNVHLAIQAYSVTLDSVNLNYKFKSINNLWRQNFRN